MILSEIPRHIMLWWEILYIIIFGRLYNEDGIIVSCWLRLLLLNTLWKCNACVSSGVHVVS